MTPRNGFATSSEQELFMRHGGHATADENHDLEEPKEVSVTQRETTRDGRKKTKGKVVRKNIQSNFAAAMMLGREMDAGKHSREGRCAGSEEDVCVYKGDFTTEGKGAHNRTWV